MSGFKGCIAVCAFGLLASTAAANVFSMGGTRNTDGTWTGIASLETVAVGNPGNAGVLSGAGAGGYGPGRICGAVSYTYSISKYEVTAGQYTVFLNAVAKTDTYGLYNTSMWSDVYGCKIERMGVSGDYTYRVADDWANRPVNFVSWGDAARFANWLHNGQPTWAQNPNATEYGSYELAGATSELALEAMTRKADATWVVPKEDEWYKAAYHKNDGVTDHYWDYPTSSDLDPGRDLADATGNNANYNPLSDPYPIDSDKYTTVVGQFKNSASPYGTFDQGGNVWEWTDELQSSLLRGGSFMPDPDDLRAATRDCFVYSPTIERGFIGFRLALVPEPTTLTLLAFGGFVLRRARRR